jgi:hypothetical protein
MEIWPHHCIRCYYYRSLRLNLTLSILRLPVGDFSGWGAGLICVLDLEVSLLREKIKLGGGHSLLFTSTYSESVSESCLLVAFVPPRHFDGSFQVVNTSPQ